MSDIFQEIDEDLRRERLLGFWRRHGTAVVALSLGVLVGIGGYMGWRDYKSAQLDANAEALAAAAQLVTDNKQAEAAKAFADLANEAGGNYGDLARMNAAAATLAGGDVAGAVAAYDAVAGSSGDVSIAALARVLAVQALMDTAPAADLDARLDAVGAAAGFAPAVKELRAYVRLKAGATDEARRLLAEVVDDNAAPSRLKARAQEVLDALGGRLPAAPAQPSVQPPESEGQRP
ncbi:tetratricopeptide repeat protein [Zavarzinia aquatilis]|uniref:tetratricopeptide repeat protein n=1 Tax=Zavarzinia aquatilis TaxID=2211142 RepID=UPI001403E81C|nr:tetratricopeptide repeat protein [Zavarzinia aquatilis]